MILGRPRHVKGMKNEQVDIGTWNVNTMLKAGKMQEIADQIVGSQIYMEHECMQLEECNTE